MRRGPAPETLLKNFNQNRVGGTEHGGSDESNLTYQLQLKLLTWNETLHLLVMSNFLNGNMFCKAAALL